GLAGFPAGHGTGGDAVGQAVFFALGDGIEGPVAVVLAGEFGGRVVDLAIPAAAEAHAGPVGAEVLENAGDVVQLAFAYRFIEYEVGDVFSGGAVDVGVAVLVDKAGVGLVAQPVGRVLHAEAEHDAQPGRAVGVGLGTELCDVVGAERFGRGLKAVPG